MIKVVGDAPRVLYKFMSLPEHVEAFCAGQVRLTTIEICRNIEDSGRVDLGEAQDVEKVHAARGADLTPRIRRAWGMPDDAFVFYGTHTTRLIDAHILCTSLAYEPEKMTNYGSPCVEIFEPVRFMEVLTNYLRRNKGVVHGGMAPVTYADREHEGPAASMNGYVKPRDPFEKDNEYRPRWWLASGRATKPLDPIHDVNCPDLAAFCRPVAAR